jgi:hypothetical protein
MDLIKAFQYLIKYEDKDCVHRKSRSHMARKRFATSNAPSAGFLTCLINKKDFLLSALFISLWQNLSKNDN